MPSYQKQFQDFDATLLPIARAKCTDETTVVKALLMEASLPDELVKQIHQQATDIAKHLRAKAKEEDGVSALLSQYGLSTDEGTALMCLAEAMLRVPDKKTVDALIEDKIANVDWRKHTGQSHSTFVNAATWGLVLTGKVLKKSSDTRGLGHAMHNLIARLGEPIVREAVKQAMQVFGQQFVMGQTMTEAIKKSKPLLAHNYLFSYDMLGEAARTTADSDRYLKSYEDAIQALSDPENTDELNRRPGVSIKLSALYPRYEFAHHAQAVSVLTDRFLSLVKLAKAGRVTVTMDAEEADRLEMSLEIFKGVFCHPDLADWSGLGLAVQSYQKRATHVLEWLIDLARTQNKTIMIRLIKGAYWDTEIKHAQVMGYAGYPVFTCKPSTDVSYLVCAKRLIQADDVVYPQFATHNAFTVSTILALIKPEQPFEFQCLHGMGKTMYDQLLSDHPGRFPCRMYAPVGGYQDLLPYLVRRLLENGANSSFVNHIVDPKMSIEKLVADPVDVVRSLKKIPNPNIPLPRDLYPHGRINSQGLDLTDPVSLDATAKVMDHAHTKAKVFGPLVAKPLEALTRTTQPITNPANREEILGQLQQTLPEDLEQAIQTACEARFGWDQTPIERRAEYLLRAADLLEERMPMFMALACQEAGKLWSDAVAEVREAVDFLRYYAKQATETLIPQTMPGPTGEDNVLTTHGRGVMLCISPWNFPLAIFVGQLSAALVAGNVVLAKPATQTIMIATAMVHLFHEVGLPREVLQLLPGGAKEVGEPLVKDTRIAGVMLTGSTFTGKAIQRALANRDGAIATLVAETGGQNAMIVDSSALPEQVVADVIESAFKSAGQRCSALRVLFLQEDVADKIIDMLKGAMALLSIGDPALLSTDVGPVIDDLALKRLQDHQVVLEKMGRLIYACPLNDDLNKGTFFAPIAYEIDRLSQLEGEVFGPVLHVIRYASSDLDQVIDDINQTGFGLTLGIQTRIASVAENIIQKVHVGNVYVNRNMIGAVVGVQPFGGEGLSGTGPKAGGPHYLSRLVVERTISNNIAAVGGNTSLLTMSADEDPGETDPST